MRTKKTIVTATFIGTLGCGVYFLAMARAAGIPATDTLVYSGTLDDAGTPIDGSTKMRVSLFDDASTGSQVCTTGLIDIAVDAGSFDIPLPAACV